MTTTSSYEEIFRINGGFTEDEYRHHVFNVDESQLDSYLQTGLIPYLVPDSSDFQIIMQKAFMVLELNPNEFEIDELQYKFNCVFHRVLTLYYRFLQEGYLYPTEDPNATTRINFDKCEQYILQFNRLFELLYYWEMGVRSMYCVRRVCNPAYDSTQNTDIGLFRFNVINWKNLAPNQKLLLYLLMDLAERGWRKKGEFCMERILTDEGFDTRTWKPAMKISAYVTMMTSLNKSIPQWLNMTNPAVNKSKIVTHLVEADDLHFTNIDKNRNLFSYPSGIYRTKVYNEETSSYSDRWYFHRAEKEEPDEHLSREVVSGTCCRYFRTDLELDENLLRSSDMTTWREIDTPVFQGVLEDQHFEPEVCDWMYILCGRLLHEVNELEDWQIMPFLLGKAGTGKSTIINKVVKLFFDEEDVRVLANSIERQFGLWALVKDNALLWIAPEINDQCQVEQCMVQSMIAGEAVAIAKKYENAETINRFRIPGIAGGNKFFGFTDSQGSIARRFVIFYFAHFVPKADTKLGEKLEAEVPYLLIKCNRAYLDAVNKFGQQGLWSPGVLPKYFWNTRRQVAESSNSFMSFLSQCDQLERSPECYMEARKFKELYKRYCEENQLPKLSLTHEVMEAPMQALGLSIVRKQMIDPLDHQKRKLNWVLGVRQVVHSLEKVPPADDPSSRPTTSEIEEDFE